MNKDVRKTLSVSSKQQNKQLPVGKQCGEFQYPKLQINKLLPGVNRLHSYILLPYPLLFQLILYIKFVLYQ
ncbi:Sodium-dependent low-affinity dicarboxylate transporter [Dirofilaria immitis]